VTESSKMKATFKRAGVGGNPVGQIYLNGLRSGIRNVNPNL